MADTMTLIKIESYKGKEIYIFEDESAVIPGYLFVTYNHNGIDIDWEFMEEINFEFPR